MKKAMPAGRQGFTLFELLVSISIIGILVAIASFSFSAAQRKARDSRRMEDMKNLQTAAEQFYAQNNYNYPGTTDSPWAVGSQTILEVFPTDPKATSSYTADVGTSASYFFCATLENNSGNSSGNCVFIGIGGTGSSYCVKNQQ